MKTKKALAIPAINFAETPASLKQIFNKSINIYMTPDVFFVTKFREIFQQTKLMHSTVAKSKTSHTHKWLGGPHMQYWYSSSTSPCFVQHRAAEFHEKSLTAAWQC